MWKKINRLTIWACLASALYGCAPGVKVMDGRKKPVSVYEQVLEGNTVWQGTIRVRGVVEVPSGAMLTIKPNTRVHFSSYDGDKDGVGDSGLLVKGRIIAKGTPSGLIVFTNASKSLPRSWGEIRLEHAQGGEFEYCYFSFADWGLHVHFTPTRVEYCRFEYNEGGLRFRTDPMTIRYNLFQNNKIGLRFLLSSPVIEYNTIRQNLTGVFVRERVFALRMSHNNIYENQDYNLKLGEGQEHDIDCPDNFWGASDKQAIEAKIYDKRESDYIGMVNYQPFSDTLWPVIWQ